MRTYAAMGSLALLLAVSAGVAVGPPPKRDAKAKLEALARKLSFFQTHEFIYDSDYNQMPDGVSAAYQKAVRPLFRRAYPVASLLPLLKHRDPRVRTLAAAGLYAYENPRLLLELVPLLEDRAETFPEVESPGNFRIGNPAGVMPPMRRQKVADVVRRFLDVYLQAAGYHDGIAPDNGRPGLADYWARRKDRTYCASWFAVRLKRARGPNWQTREELRGAVRPIRQEIDRLPEVDRALTLLWLWDQMGHANLVDEKELLEVCKGLGPDRLLDLLRRRPLNTDPDIYPKGTKHLVPAILVVILPHAKALFRPKDADALLACASFEGNYPWAAWFIAAANLQPKRAGAILDQGWKAGAGRLRITIARWRLLPGEGTAPIVKRFYDELPRDATYSQEARVEFLRELGKGWQPGDRQLLVALVRDKRFATLDWTSLETLGYLVNEVEKRVVIEPEELQKAWHPLGQSHVDWSLMEGEKKYPKETAELRRRLETWRGIMRRHLLRP